MPSFLLLHGISSRRPPEHWQFWLAAVLAADGHQVLYPGLPFPDTPSFDEWDAALADQLEVLGADGEERVVICHSLSCLLWLKSASTLAGDPRLVVDRLLLVSPPESSRVPEDGASFRLRDLDATAVRRSAAKIRIVCSDNDPFNPVGGNKLYGEPLGVETTVITGAGHITPSTGYGPWPDL